MTIDRRNFLATSAAASGAAAVLSGRGQAQESRSNQEPYRIGVIGAGGMARGNINSAKEWLKVVAVADPDDSRSASFSKEFSDGKADTYRDYRKILDRDDIDVIHIATPDHWHTKPLVEAMLSGKDVYCEKPLTLTIEEGKLIRRVQKETGRIVQVGTQQRSTYDLFVKAVALVNEGRLGKLKLVQAAIGGAPTSPEIPAVDPPKDFDWDRWLGPAPQAAFRTMNSDGQKGKDGKYHSNNHYEFRWWYEYSGGKLTDWGAHHVDICNWAMQVNGQKEGPNQISGWAKHPVEFRDGKPTVDDRYNTATAFMFTLDYPGGTQMIIRNDTDNGCLIEGDKGKIFVNRGKLTGGPVEELMDNPLPEDAIAKVYKNLPIKYNERKAHWYNFLHCVRERLEPISDVHTHMDGLNLCHLAGIAARVGRTLKWDAANETIVGDELAASMLGRPYRKGYEIVMDKREAAGS